MGMMVSMAREERANLRAQETSWDTIEVVQPGEKFLLFHPARNSTTIRRSDNGSFGGIKSSIRLKTSFLPSPLNISITTAPYIMERSAVITPFDRSQGYPLDTEDLSLRTRRTKISRMKRELAQSVEGLYLFVFAADEDQPFRGMMQEFLDESAYILASASTSLLHHLYLTLTFPNGSSFTARALPNTNRLSLLFNTFFPSDTGPLPIENTISTTKPPMNMEEGLRLLLPFHLEMVQSVQATFLVLPEKAT
jgi:hypothetical protein